MTSLPVMGAGRRLRRIARVVEWGALAGVALIVAPLVPAVFIRLVVFLAERIGLV